MNQATRVHLCTALIERGGSVLLVANRYPNQPAPLWNLPGGRQEPGELLTEALEREVFEETSLRVRVGDLLYVSESYDAETHFTNYTFAAHADGEPRLVEGDRHVVDLAWVPRDELHARLTVDVVREPLLAFLERRRRYAGYHRAGITIQFND